MYSRWSAVLFPVAVLALVFSMQWGTQQATQRDKVTIMAENQYQRAFHDLVYHLNQIKNHLGYALSVDGKSNAFHQDNLLTISRLTSDAQNEINQLPLTMLSFQETEQFLANLNKFSYQLAIRDLGNKPLQAPDLKTVKQLYAHANELTTDLNKLQTIVITKGLKWTQAEYAIASDGKLKDSPLLDGFNQLNQRVSHYKELEWGPTVTGVKQLNLNGNQSGKGKSKAEIRAIAIHQLSLSKRSAVQIVENGRGTTLQSYSIKGKDNDNQQIKADFLKANGKLLWFLNQRKIGRIQIDLDQAKYEAEHYLQAQKYPSMVAIAKDRYDGMAVVTFAEDVNGVIHYPHKLTVRVAMDNGQVIGVQATDFVTAQHQVISTKPALTEAQARTHLHSGIKVSQTKLVTIMNKTNDETLCYEFIGVMNKEKIRIYLNANTGLEEQVERVAG